VEDAGIHPAARGATQLAVKGLVISVGDQLAKLMFATGEEVRECIGVVLQLSAGVPAADWLRVSWAVPGAPAWCLPGN